MIRTYLAISMLLFGILTHAAGFDENYEVRVGDLNSDGLDDLYVKQKPQVILIHGDIVIPIVLKPDVSEFALQQNVDGTFSLVTTFTSAQRASIGSWPISAIETRATDFNNDGYVDLGLGDVANAIPNATDQIVFAARSIGVPPASVLAADANLSQFVDDVYKWYIDHSVYDVESTIDVTSAGYIGVGFNWAGALTLLAQCELVNDDCRVFLADLNDIYASAGLDCATEIAAAGGDPNVFCVFAYHVFVLITTQQTVTVQDLMNVHPDAADVINASNDVMDGTGNIESVADIFEILIAIDIGGAGVPSPDDNLEDPDNERGFDIHVVLADIWGWIFRTSQGAARQPDTVYITGHRVGWVGPFHTAIEYAIPLDPMPSYISASPKGGFLNSELDRMTEFSNVTLGTVASPNGVPSFLFGDMVIKNGNYPNNCIDYDLIPEIQDSYNSNSFTHGLVLAVSGIPDIDLNRFVGGSKPVPGSFFASGAICPF